MNAEPPYIRLMGIGGFASSTSESIGKGLKTKERSLLMAKGVGGPICLRCRAECDIKGSDNKVVCPKCGWERK